LVSDCESTARGKSIPTGFIVDVGKAGIASLFVIFVQGDGVRIMEKY
jgi:hypothetical protein